MKSWSNFSTSILSQTNTCTKDRASLSAQRRLIQDEKVLLVLAVEDFYALDWTGFDTEDGAFNAAEELVTGSMMGSDIPLYLEQVC